ncbi:HNH endonuclease signature motif containing protein [Pseudolysinimonas yzui]|uniref:HNH nuclease domain-containing protein n=1 Tax=Pseudolysinimonas yzui TaxID=2708254 RepID=A0A8J3LZT5_9MICO|nr:HNH endonuclease signature motif containing protein [Pseudolysinimonas yzui]GHF06530.1 hypothetical protein GCM10011600_03920 [Pseudolysinimonas yzui]
MSSSAPSVTWLGADPSVLDDDALLTGARELGELRRLVEASLGSFAAEVKHRSRREDGFGGLAQRLGAGTPEKLVEQVSGVSKRESQTLVRVGELLTVDADPWLAAVGTGVASGAVSVVKADVIKNGLGTPTEDVAADDLADAAQELAALAPTMSVEKLAARARELRDELDAANVRDRHRALREKRYWHMTRRSDGMTHLDALLDPDSAEPYWAAYDAATSPRRGGPRFIDDEQRERAKKLVDDERTLGQIALDTFVDLLRIATETDPDRLLGAQRYAVRVLVTDRDLRERTGAAFLGNHPDGVPLETADRHICDAGIVPVHFEDDGEPLRLGVTRRLFSSKQRDALAARDGGCRFPDCDRPASWCEAHHRIPWKHGGQTDTRDGLLLCRHHHMLVHDNHWVIDRDPVHGFVAIPPRSVDPAQRPIPMPARSPVAARLRR